MVEARIRKIKEGVRSIVSGLPFKILKVILIWVVVYVVYVTNPMPKSSGSKGSEASSRQDLTGIRPSFNRDLQFAFGQFVQAPQGVMDTSMRARTFSLVTLLSTGNPNRSIKIMNLSTGRVCVRSKRHLTPLPMPTEGISMLSTWAHATNNSTSSDHWEYKGYYLGKEGDTNCDEASMKVITSYLSPTRIAALMQPVPELAVPTTFASILDGLEMVNPVEAGVDLADLAYTVPEYASEPEPPLQPPPYPPRFRSRPDYYQVKLAMNPTIKIYSLSLEAINTRGADVAKNAALNELNQLIEKGCVMPVDRLTVKKLKAEKQLIFPLKLFLKDKYPIEHSARLSIKFVLENLLLKMNSIFISVYQTNRRYSTKKTKAQSDY